MIGWTLVGLGVFIIEIDTNFEHVMHISFLISIVVGMNFVAVIKTRKISGNNVRKNCLIYNTL